MRNPEIPMDSSFLAKSREFFNLKEKNGVNKVLLKGPEDASVVSLNTLIALSYPDLTSEDVNMNIIGAEAAGASSLQLCNRILELNIPKRVRKFKIKDDYKTRNLWEGVFTCHGMPYVELVFGKSKATGEEIIILASCLGISPDTALAEIKEEISKIM